MWHVSQYCHSMFNSHFVSMLRNCSMLNICLAIFRFQNRWHLVIFKEQLRNAFFLLRYMKWRLFGWHGFTRCPQLAFWIFFQREKILLSGNKAEIGLYLMPYLNEWMEKSVWVVNQVGLVVLIVFYVLSEQRCKLLPSSFLQKSRAKIFLSVFTLKNFSKFFFSKFEKNDYCNV